MAQTRHIIRFEPHGPADTGLVEWDPMDPASLVAGDPVQRGHIYHEDAAAGYLAGVWDCTAFTQRMEPYPVDEFMYLLEGALVMVMPDGAEITIAAGQGFIIPKGLECQWRQEGYLRKFFMILERPDTAGRNASLDRITVPDLAPLAPAGTAVERRRTDFVNASGAMQVCLRDCADADLAALPVTENLLIQVIEGRLTLTEDGETHGFGPGEAAYIRAGATVGWRTEAGARLLQSSYAGGAA